MSPASAELDHATLSQAGQHDREACRAVIRRFRRPVGALLYRMLAPSGLDHLVEDLAQEAFIRAFGALPRFDPDGPAKFSTWLLRITARLAINELRRVRPVVEPLPTTDEAVAGGGQADDVVVRRAIAAAIETAVAELAPEYRAAFVLRDYHGLPYADIAETLGLEVGTVKSRISRARAQLREALAQVHRG